MQINYRFLNPATDFSALHAAFLEAFSDYVVPFKLSEAQLENHIRLNAVDLSCSVGAFAGEKMIGFSLNGFGRWEGKQTAYDAGTGVVPNFRSNSVGAGMFDFMIPRLSEDGIEQILLEVITKNERAVRLYRRLGFQETRKLLIFEQTKKNESAAAPSKDFKIRQIAAPDWNRLKTFCDASPSWQNTFEAVERNKMQKIMLGAFVRDACVGYAVMFSKYGVVAALAVEQNYRRRGAASLLLSELQKRCEKDRLLRFNNVDSRLENAAEFLKKRNFSETLSQFEMIKKL